MDEKSSIEDLVKANPYMGIITEEDGGYHIHECIPPKPEQNTIDIAKYRKYQLSGLWREFSDKYEYIHIDGYEDCLVFSTLHSIPLGDVFAQLLEFIDDDGEYNLHVASVEFKKSQFNLRQSLEWLDMYHVDIACLEDHGQFIHHANKIVEGIHFNGVPVLLYEKGINTVQCEDTYIEVTETFKAYQTLIDSRQSKEIQLQQTKDGGAVTYGDEKDYNAKIIYNDVLIDYIPVLFFERSQDVVICNGNVILCDYIAPYKGRSVGFYQGLYKEETESIPISFLLDMDTTIYMSVQVRLDGSKFCVITYNYIIDDHI